VIARETTLQLTDAYRRMLTIRLFEQRCIDLSGDAIAGSVHLCGGQEAIPVGARSALQPDDRVVATYRGHGWAIEWGIPLPELMGEICQRAGGVNGGRAGSPGRRLDQRYDHLHRHAAQDEADRHGERAHLRHPAHDAGDDGLRRHRTE